MFQNEWVGGCAWGFLLSEYAGIEGFKCFNRAREARGCWIWGRGLEK